MTTLLLCTVGNRDVDWKIPGLSEALSQRERAEHVLAHYRTLRKHIRLPIIRKALRHVLARHSTPPDMVVLIASNQFDTTPSDPRELRNWHTDTCLTAQIIHQCLADGGADWQAVLPERVQIWLIGDDGGQRDPSDYDGVRRWLERRLPALHAAHPDASAYLQVTGGTPAMTTGLMVAGTEVFGARAEVLYVYERHELPQTLNIGKRLQAHPLRATLRASVRVFAYDAALHTLHQHAPAITDRLEAGAGDVLDALLAYAHHRFNFDLPAATQALHHAAAGAGDGRWSKQLMAFYDAVHATGRLAQVEEVYHGAAARYEVGAYADVLTQVVRFQENLLRAMCLERGARFLLHGSMQQDDSGGLLDGAWALAQGFQPRGVNAGDHISTGWKQLQNLLRHLSRQRGENLSAILNALCSDSMVRLVYLRNELTHSLRGVGKAELARKFGGEHAPDNTADEIVPHLARCFELVAGRAPAPPPFAAINALVETLLREREDT